MLVVKLVGYALLMAALGGIGVYAASGFIEGTEERRTFRFAFMGLSLAAFLFFALVQVSEQSLEDQTTSLNSTVQSQASQITNLNAQIATENTQVASQNTKIANLTAQVAALKSLLDRAKEKKRFGKRSSMTSEQLATAAVQFSARLRQFWGLLMQAQKVSYLRTRSIQSLSDAEVPFRIEYFAHLRAPSQYYYEQLLQRLSPKQAADPSVHTNLFEPSTLFNSVGFLGPNLLEKMAKEVYPPISIPSPVPIDLGHTVFANPSQPKP